MVDLEITENSTDNKDSGRRFKHYIKFKHQRISKWKEGFPDVTTSVKSKYHVQKDMQQHQTLS